MMIRIVLDLPKACLGQDQIGASIVQKDHREQVYKCECNMENESVICLIVFTRMYVIVE